MANHVVGPDETGTIGGTSRMRGAKARPRVDAAAEVRGRRVLFPLPSIDRTMVVHLRDLLASGRFRPLLDRQYPLEQIVEAYRYVESGQKIGNVMIAVRPTE